jgi:hypothetical protein
MRAVPGRLVLVCRYPPCCSLPRGPAGFLKDRALPLPMLFGLRKLRDDRAAWREFGTGPPPQKTLLAAPLSSARPSLARHGPHGERMGQGCQAQRICTALLR